MLRFIKYYLEDRKQQVVVGCNMYHGQKKLLNIALLYGLWLPKSSNQLATFEAIQKREIKWIHCRKFDHDKDNEYLDKQKELSILSIKFCYSLVSIKLPGYFDILQADQVRYNRKTSTII